MLHKKHAGLAKATRIVFWVFTGMNAAAAYWSKLPEWDNGGIVYAAIRASGREYGAIAVLIASAVMTLSALAYKYLGSAETWQSLHELISDLQGAIFRGGQYGMLDSHKVTIFRVRCSRPSDHWIVKTWCAIFGGGKWLVPVARSHHTSQDTSTCFELNDDGDKCIGVAGQAWARKQVVAVHDLPDVSAQNGEPKKKEIEAYCGRGFVTKEWVAEKHPKARAILAIPLLVKGEPWGVLVFDSRSPDKIRYDDLEEIFTVIQKHINRLLTKHL